MMFLPFFERIRRYHTILRLILVTRDALPTPRNIRVKHGLRTFMLDRFLRRADAAVICATIRCELRRRGIRLIDVASEWDKLEARTVAG